MNHKQENILRTIRGQEEGLFFIFKPIVNGWCQSVVLPKLSLNAPEMGEVTCKRALKFEFEMKTPYPKPAHTFFFARQLGDSPCICMVLAYVCCGQSGKFWVETSNVNYAIYWPPNLNDNVQKTNRYTWYSQKNWSSRWLDVSNPIKQ